MRMPTADGRDLAMLLLFVLFCCALAGIIRCSCFSSAMHLASTHLTKIRVMAQLGILSAMSVSATMCVASHHGSGPASRLRSAHCEDVSNVSRDRLVVGSHVAANRNNLSPS